MSFMISYTRTTASTAATRRRVTVAASAAAKAARAAAGGAAAVLHVGCDGLAGGVDGFAADDDDGVRHGRRLCGG